MIVSGVKHSVVLGNGFLGHKPGKSWHEQLDLISNLVVERIKDGMVE